MTGFHSDPARGLEMAELDLKVATLVREGVSFRDIGAQLGISKSYAYLCFKRAKARIDDEIADLARQYLRDHLAECAADRHAVLEVLHAEHVVVSNGQVVQLGGKPLEDSGPVLAAVDRLLKIRDQEAGYLGLKAKTEVNISGGVTYQILGLATEDLM